ncbi:alpha/beta hydrolase [Pseudomonas luteola]|uniref:alpha/beta hydrolase n=1 Tax=Pseudomonas luteola TaxID=47886 RepID=UPI000F7930EE|nr:alpha/beta hydrolase-fold protein [Pseudomonas luteola]RRW40390.1 alpha/beta hydrolase [Pseudomonas luteola]
MLLRIAGLALTLCVALSAQAKPEMNEPLNDSILHQTDLPYQFSEIYLQAQADHARYHVWIAKPNRPAPPEGYPALFMLDGNAVLGSLNAHLLETLNAGAAPALVIVGYDSPLRIERRARTYDYTTRYSADEIQLDPLTGLPSGGAEEFLDWLAKDLKPELAKRLPLDSRRQALWGHSYGGLLVLHALLTRPGEFDTYYTVSPSLWWGNGQLLEQQEGLARRFAGRHVCVHVARGKEEPARPAPLENKPAPTSLSQQSAQEMVKRLEQIPGLTATYTEFSGMNHGAMFNTSLAWAAKNFSAKTPTCEL